MCPMTKLTANQNTHFDYLDGVDASQYPTVAGDVQCIASINCACLKSRMSEIQGVCPHTAHTSHVYGPLSPEQNIQLFIPTVPTVTSCSRET